MPNELHEDLGRLLVAFGIVACVAMPVGAIAALWSFRNQQKLVPSWRLPTRLPQSGLNAEAFDFIYILCFFLIYAGLNPALVHFTQQVLESLGFFHWAYGPTASMPDGPPTVLVRKLWAMPVPALALCVIWLLYLRFSRRRLIPIRSDGFIRDLALGVVAWLFLTPIVFAVHRITTGIAIRLGSPPEKHPFTRQGIGETTLDQLLFALVVCLFTPLIEEILFRGLLVDWVSGRRYRPWILTVLAGCIALLSTEQFVAPLGFVVILAVGLIVIQSSRRLGNRVPTRTTASIYSTAILFAAAHAAIWPTPIPLFVLGLGLGYVAARTRGVAACVVMHGLFNAVSFVYLLGGGTG